MQVQKKEGILTPTRLVVEIDRCQVGPERLPGAGDAAGDGILVGDAGHQGLLPFQGLPVDGQRREGGIVEFDTLARPSSSRKPRSGVGIPAEGFWSNSLRDCPKNN